MNDYTVTIEFEVMEYQVEAKSKADAKAKILRKLKKQSPVGLIKRNWSTNEKLIEVEQN